jgi:hypothetical protein
MNYLRIYTRNDSRGLCHENFYYSNFEYRVYLVTNYKAFNTSHILANNQLTMFIFTSGKTVGAKAMTLFTIVILTIGCI